MPNLGGGYSSGGSGAPTNATYIVQTSNGILTNEQALAGLSTGILKSTTSTGVLSIAVAGTDYLAPAGNGSALTNLNASNLGSGTVNTARLGSGTASATTFLSGSSVWATPSHTNLFNLNSDDHTQYHTDARALAWLGTKSTSDLSEGTNLYYTNTRADGRITAAIGTSVAPHNATYITQTANANLSAEQALSALSTGLVKVTTGTGVLSTATAGTDYLAPTSSYFSATTSGNKTSVVVQAGYAELGGLDHTFSLKNSDGTEVGYMRADGSISFTYFNTPDNNSASFNDQTNSFSRIGMNLCMSAGIYWSDTTKWWDGTKDLALARSGASELHVRAGDSGTANIKLNSTTADRAASQTTPFHTYKGESSTTASQTIAVVDADWLDNTHATRKGRLRRYAADYTGTNKETSREWSDASSGRFALSTPSSAPTDAHLANGQISFYVDESGHNLKIRVKYSDGTLKTATIALT